MKKTHRILVSITALFICLALLCGCTKSSSASDKKGMIFENGLAMPFVTYSNLRSKDYSNTDSDIMRFCVYVETDNDTDNDGMADLVKVFVQVPRAAAEGNYLAASIYDPTPYGAGTTVYFDNDSQFLELYEDAGFDYELLYKDCKKRAPESSVTTMDLALKADPDDWNKTGPYSEAETGFTYASKYDYYLLRGFAVVECGGLGTYGSEGFELCGMDLERDAHKCVVEWLAGNRTAYTSLEGSSTVAADWSNGCVAMIGKSYGGTLTYEVATTGVEGLKTIIPIAGIASWYEYTNSQGIYIAGAANYADMLAIYNAGGTFIDDNWTVMDDGYASFLHQMANDQLATNGDYGEIWTMSDYSRDYGKISCSALIVHGLNDFNVKTKQADLMYSAFKSAGQNVKLVLHQDAHSLLDSYMVNGELWQETVNKWLCHYLYGVDNGIENMAELTVQNNLSGEYETYDSWRDFTYKEVAAANADKNETVKSYGQTDYYQNLIGEYCPSADLYLNIPEESRVIYDLNIPAGSTIKGVPIIKLELSTDTSDIDGLMVSAALIDVADDGKPFKAYESDPDLNAQVTYKTIGEFQLGEGHDAVPVKELVKSYVVGKYICGGWTDLCNPESGYYSDECSEKCELIKGQKYSYSLYLNPTVYTVEENHSLKLVLFTQDPCAIYDGDLSKIDYSFTVYADSLDIQIPFAE